MRKHFVTFKSFVEIKDKKLKKKLKKLKHNNFHRCNPAFYSQTNCSVLLCRVFSSNLVVYLVIFGSLT